MNISQLKALDAAIRTKSYSKAAQELGISQPAVSRQLRDLEKQYQVRLIFRRGKQIEFTPLALALVRKARVCLTFINDMEETLQAQGHLKAGSFRIGLSCHNLVMELLASFMERYPDVMVSTHVSDSENLLAGVLDSSLDIAAITALDPDPRVANFLYNRQRIVAVVRQDAPCVSEGAVDVGKLREMPMIARHNTSGTRTIFARQLAELDIVPQVVLELDSYDAMLEAVAAGIGFAIVLEDEFNGDKRLRSLPFQGSAMVANQYLVYLPEYKELNVVGSFLNLAREAKVIKQFTEQRKSA